MLAMLQGYMDESADKDARIFCIGGFFGRSDEWSPLLLEWVDRIQPHRLPHPIKAFHMTDCENGGGEFRDELGWDRDSRKQLIIDLIQIICRYTVGMFGMGLPIQEYEALDPVTTNPSNDKGIKLGGGQYRFLLQSVMADLAIEMEDTAFPAHEDIAFFFDRNSPHESWANILHKEMQNCGRPWSRRIGSLTFDSKEKLRLLQVADVGAYECRKYIVNHIFKEGRTRKSFETLKDRHRIWKIAAFNKDNLKEMLEDKQEEYFANLAK